MKRFSRPTSRRFSRAAATAVCAGSLAIGGLVVADSAQAAAPYTASSYNMPSTRQALATSVDVSGVISAVPTDTVTSLPLLGTSLIVDVTSAPGGALASVDVSPNTGLTATTDRPGKVRFVNADGTAKVEVSSRGGGQNVEAKAGQLSDVAGPGTWSGDVFGTGTATTVNFTTVANPDGSPGITGVTTSDTTAEIGDVRTRSHDDSQEASLSIRFTSGIQSRSLTIRVSTSSHDGQSRAKVAVSLSRVNGQSLPAADVVGAQVWNGVLCDGTPASISYTVNADGSISGASATPAATIDQQSGSGIKVQFADNQSVRIRVKSSDDDATFRVSVDERIRCAAADPAVNTPVSTTVPDDHGDDGPNHDAGDDHGNDGANHDVGDDHGGASQGSGNQGGDDQGGGSHGGDDGGHGGGGQHG
jgi:hypothetical protein